MRNRLKTGLLSLIGQNRMLNIGLSPMNVKLMTSYLPSLSFYPGEKMMQATIGWPYRLRNPNREAKYARRQLVDRISSGEKRALKLGLFVERVSRSKLFRIHKGKCGICGERVRERTFEIDHRIPLSKGGEHSYANCQPSHTFCNRLKADKMPHEVVIRTRKRAKKSKGYINQRVALR